jgi:hypothetical protein
METVASNELWVTYLFLHFWKVHKELFATLVGMFHKVCSQFNTMTGALATNHIPN